VRMLDFIQDLNLKKDETDESASTHLYDVAQGLAGCVVQTKCGINISNIRQDPRFDSAVDIKCGYSGHASLLCAPMLANNGEVMGVVQLAKGSVSQFGAKDLHLLHVIGSQAGIMLYNREKHEQAVEKTVDNIVAVTGSVMKCLEVQPSIDIVVNRICDRAVVVVPSENAVVLFRGRHSGIEDVWTKVATREEDIRRYTKSTTRTVFSGERTNRDVQISLDNGIISEAFNTRGPVEVHNAIADSRVNWEFEAFTTTELKNMLVLPIYRSSKCPGVGLLILINKRDGNFVWEDSRKLDHLRDAISPE